MYFGGFSQFEHICVTSTRIRKQHCQFPSLAFSSHYFPPNDAHSPASNTTDCFRWFWTLYNWNHNYVLSVRRLFMKFSHTVTCSGVYSCFLLCSSPLVNMPQFSLLLNSICIAPSLFLLLIVPLYTKCFCISAIHFPFCSSFLFVTSLSLTY